MADGFDYVRDALKYKAMAKDEEVALAFVRAAIEFRSIHSLRLFYVDEYEERCNLGDLIKGFIHQGLLAGNLKAERITIYNELFGREELIGAPELRQLKEGFLSVELSDTWETVSFVIDRISTYPIVEIRERISSFADVELITKEKAFPAYQRVLLEKTILQSRCDALEKNSDLSSKGLSDSFSRKRKAGAIEGYKKRPECRNKARLLLFWLALVAVNGLENTKDLGFKEFLRHAGFGALKNEFEGSYNEGTIEKNLSQWRQGDIRGFNEATLFLLNGMLSSLKIPRAVSEILEGKEIVPSIKGALAACGHSLDDAALARILSKSYACQATTTVAQ